MTTMRKHTMTSLRIAALTLVALAVGCTTAPEVKPDPVVVDAPPPPPKEKGADEAFADAVKAFDQGKLDEAGELFAKVAKKAPDNVSAHYNLGVVAERKGDIKGAGAHYEKAHALDAEHTPTLLNLGKVYRLQGQFDKAIALYEKALALPGREFDVQLLNNLSVSYRLAKQYGKAEGALRKLLSRTKDNPEAYKNLALVYYDQGNYRLAEFISANARKLDDKDPGVYNNLGMIYLKQDQKPLALAQFQKAVELNPNFAPGHLNIGAMALSYRDYEAAEKALRRALSLDPNSAEAHLYLAYTLDGQRNRDAKKGLEAGKSFEKYLEWRPESPEVKCAAGWAYAADRAGWDKAVSFLTQCKDFPTTSAQDKQMIDGRLKAIEAMAKSGQKEEAAPEQRREAPKPGTGTSLLDKVSAEEEAREAAEGTPAPTPTPSDGEAAPQ
jgi:tetratricopeptide (TPR) repeat protein